GSGARARAGAVGDEDLRARSAGWEVVVSHAERPAGGPEVEDAGEGLVVTDRRTGGGLIDNNRIGPAGAAIGRFRKHDLVVVEGAEARVHPDHEEVTRTRVDADVGYSRACPDLGSVVR